MIIYLDDFRKARAARSAVKDPQKEGLQHCNINGPDSTCEFFSIQRRAMHGLHLHEDFTSVDIDNKVIDRLYALASQF